MLQSCIHAVPETAGKAFPCIKCYVYVLYFVLLNTYSTTERSGGDIDHRHITLIFNPAPKKMSEC